MRETAVSKVPEKGSIDNVESKLCVGLCRGAGEKRPGRRGGGGGVRCHRVGNPGRCRKSSDEAVPRGGRAVTAHLSRRLTRGARGPA